MVTTNKGILSQTPVPTGFIKSAISRQCLDKPLYSYGWAGTSTPIPHIYLVFEHFEPISGVY